MQSQPPPDSTAIDQNQLRGTSLPPADRPDDASTRSMVSGAGLDEQHDLVLQEPDVNESDKTVISTAPPLPAGPVPSGLHPRELGRALVGQRLDELWLEEFVGGGGMGAVFRALDTKLNRAVAVKVLSTHQARDGEVARRFQVEAQSAARLDHPHIARVHYVGEDRGLPYIVFEYIEGVNLRDAVYTSGPLHLAEALNFTLQIADALAHAWQRDVVHRDIKPSNILITPDGQAKLVDMGLARLHQVDHADHDLTASGMTLGTFDYISPEQARNPRDADTRSDIYSLGCTLFFMLTGKPPFSGGTALQKLLQHQGENPPDLQNFRPDISESVAALLNTMLSKRPGDRFQNPAELVAALLATTQQMGFGHARVFTATAQRTGFLRIPTVRRHAPWIVPLILLLLSVFGIELALREPSTGFLSQPLSTGETSADEGPILNSPSVNRSSVGNTP